MFHNPIVQDNLAKLEKFGYEIIKPDKGMLANGDIGDGRMPEESLLLEYILIVFCLLMDYANHVQFLYCCY